MLALTFRGMTRGCRRMVRHAPGRAGVSPE
ncbi:hypothetical protein GGE06_004746 [Streptomyces sp. SFB5A]|uniref:Uncharacterized protein n=1 Tax=Streptomyces nymphaeiformis TaxID=2663842 RepID=A0A7W7U2F2_9ACTN|nr:hypothetical protein [Streptomyces nymphaeiformis]